MTRRFTCTEKWDDVWFSELTTSMKLCWLYIVDRCNHAGIFRPNLKAMVFYCDLPPITTKEDILNVLDEEIVIIGEDWFLPGFIKFQYPRGLTSNKPAVVSVKKALQTHEYYKVIKKTLDNNSIKIT